MIRPLRFWPPIFAYSAPGNTTDRSEETYDVDSPFDRVRTGAYRLESFERAQSTQGTTYYEFAAYPRDSDHARALATVRGCFRTSTADSDHSYSHYRYEDRNSEPLCTVLGHSLRISNSLTLLNAGSRRERTIGPHWERFLSPSILVR